MSAGLREPFFGTLDGRDKDRFGVGPEARNNMVGAIPRPSLVEPVDNVEVLPIRPGCHVRVPDGIGEWPAPYNLADCAVSCSAATLRVERSA